MTRLASTARPDPLRATDWFEGLSEEQRATFGLYRWAAAMKTGWHFENLLQRGLLMWAMGLPNGAPEFRYAHHEIIEESQHTLMFQELVNRSQLPVRGMPRWARTLGEVFAVRAARYAPATFFVLVLGGEDPADHVQREELRHGRPHPLVEQIIRMRELCDELGLMTPVARRLWRWGGVAAVEG